MIWNDQSSNPWITSMAGALGTHDEITEDFFADTPVQVRDYVKKRN